MVVNTATIGQLPNRSALADDDLLEILGNDQISYNITVSQIVSLINELTIPLTTKGDLLTYDTEIVRFGIGSDGQVLTANSSSTTGMSWSTSSGGITGPTTSTDTAMAIWDGTNGDALEDSTITYTAGTPNLLNVEAALVMVDQSTLASSSLAFLQYHSNILKMNAPSGESIQLLIDDDISVEVFEDNVNFQGLDIQNLNLLSSVTTSTSIVYDDGIKQTFNPDSDNAGVNVGSNATAPTVPIDGDIYYDSATSTFEFYQAAAWVSLLDNSPLWTNNADANSFSLTNLGFLQLVAGDDGNDAPVLLDMVGGHIATVSSGTELGYIQFKDYGNDGSSDTDYLYVRLYTSIFDDGETSNSPNGSLEIRVRTDGAMQEYFNFNSFGGGQITILRDLVGSGTPALTGMDIDADENTISNFLLGTNVDGALENLSDVTISTQAKGDMIIADNQSDWINLALGTDGQVLSVDGTTPTWESLVIDAFTYNQQSGTTYSFDTDDIMVGMTNTAARTVTIDSDVITTAGRNIFIKDEAGTAGVAGSSITIATQASETIDGESSITIVANHGIARLYSNGTNLFSW